MMDIRIKRAYEVPSAGDGTRILIDRLWPRGLKKDSAAIALWLKDIAPTTELREWFDHDPAKWVEFQKRYKHELGSRTELIAAIKDRIGEGTVTLIYGAKDEQHNHAIVLQNFLASQK